MRNDEEFEDIVRRDLDVRASDEAYDRMRDIVLSAHGPTRTTESATTLIFTRRMIMRISTARIAVAALIGAGVVTAAAVGVSIQKYRFVEKRPEQGYIVRSEDGHSGMNITENQAASPEQAVATAEEIAILRQQGQRELVHAGEIEVNGQLDNRVLGYKYSLADGRTITVAEGDPDAHAPLTLTGERLAEAGRLLRQAVASSRRVAEPVTVDGGTIYDPAVEADKRTEIPTFERVIQGRTFTFKKYEFALSDGAQVAWSIGTLKDSQ